MKTSSVFVNHKIPERNPSNSMGAFRSLLFQFLEARTSPVQPFSSQDMPGYSSYEEDP